MTTNRPKCTGELWPLLGQGNLAHCPAYESCAVRRDGAWCPNDDVEDAFRLIDGATFEPNQSIAICPVRCRTFEVVESLADSWLEADGVRRPPVPTSLTFLADHHPIEIRKLPLKAIHGVIWRLSNEWVIQLNEADTPAEQRFTLFHEAFHIFTLSQYQMTAPHEFRVSRGTFMEQLANYFAGCVLMPRKWLAREYAATQDLEKLAAVFDTTPALVYVRLKRLGLA